MIDPLTGKKKRVRNPADHPTWTAAPTTNKSRAGRKPQSQAKRSDPNHPNPIDLSSLASTTSQGSGTNTQSSTSERGPSSPNRTDSVDAASLVKAGEKDYYKFLDEGLPLFTWILGLLLGLLLFKDMQLGADIFTMQDAEIDAIAPPLAAYMAKQKIPARVKKIIVSSNDTIGLIAGFGMYFQRVGANIQEVVQNANHQVEPVSAHGTAPQPQSGGDKRDGIPADDSGPRINVAGIPLVDPSFNGVGTY